MSAPPSRITGGTQTPATQFRKNRRVKLSLGLPITGAFLFPTFACREAVECDGLIADDQLEEIAKAKAAGIYKVRPASIDAAQVRAMKVCEGPQDRGASVYRVLDASGPGTSIRSLIPAPARLSAWGWMRPRWRPRPIEQRQPKGKVGSRTQMTPPRQQSLRR
jgi:hypothetical protein